MVIRAHSSMEGCLQIVIFAKTIGKLTVFPEQILVDE